MPRKKKKQKQINLDFQFTIEFFIFIFIVILLAIFLLASLWEKEDAFNIDKLHYPITALKQDKVNVNNENDKDKENLLKHCFAKNEENYLYDLYLFPAEKRYYLYLNFDNYIDRTYLWDFKRKKKCQKINDKVTCKRLENNLLEQEEKDFYALLNLIKIRDDFYCEYINFDPRRFSLSQH